MTVRQRILTIRLMEKTKTNPAYADRLGIVVTSSSGTEGVKNESNQES